MVQPATIRKTLRIFISSPDDTRPERLIAADLVKKLAREFSSHFEITAVLWEREPLIAAEHFQTSITPPHETDIVVVILRSRLGTLLPAEFQGAITGRRVTGTEWEFEDALAAYRDTHRPDILLYRNPVERQLGSGNNAALKEQITQNEALEDFMRRWFIDAGNNTVKLAFRTFTSTAEFTELLEMHLRGLLEQKIGGFPGNGRLPSSSNPFRGLQAFELEHAEMFYGRARACHELRELLARQIAAGRAFIMVFGASGSGKSSLVKAGLLWHLRLPGMIPRVALCRYTIFRPAEAPENLFAGLAKALLGVNALAELSALQYDSSNLAALLHDAPKQAVLPIRQGLAAAAEKAQLTELAEARLVLIIDQLEELFTIAGLQPETRTAFVETLEVLAESGLVWVLTTMRSDFFDQLERVPVLARISAGEARYLLTPPDASEIGQIVRQPAREAGLHYEVDRVNGNSLDDELCQAAVQAPSALPLLEFTLDQLWHQRTEEGELTFAAYRSLGGLEGALGKRAEEEFAKLTAEVQEALPQVLRTLATVELGTGGKITARVAKFAAFAPDSPSKRLIDAFLMPQARLLIADNEDDTSKVRVAHEALLTHWSRAKEQLKKDLRDLQIRTRLEQAATVWDSAAPDDRGDRLLHKGAPLDEAEDLLKRRRNELDKILIAFIEASSITVHNRERRTRRRRLILLAIFALLAILSSTAAYIANDQRKLALSGQLAARASLLAEQAPNDKVTEEAAALAIESWRRVHNPEAAKAAGMLLRMLPKYRVPRAGTVGENDKMVNVAFSPDGKLLAAAGTDAKARIMDTATGLERKPIIHEGKIFNAVFSPDGRFLATASADNTARLIEIASGNEVMRIVHDKPVHKAVFSPDGSLLATGSLDGSVRLMHTGDGKEQGRIMLGSGIHNLAFSPDGRLLAAGGEDNWLRIIEVASGKEQARAKHDAMITNVAFSRDGRILATASQDHSARLFETVTGRPLQQIKHDDIVWSVAFSADDRWLASASADHSVRVTEIATGKEINRIIHLDEKYFSVAFSPDQTLLATASLNGTVRLFDTRSWLEQARIAHGGAVWKTVFSPDGKLFATASSDGMARLFKATALPPQPQVFPAKNVNSLAFNPDGRLLAVGSGDGTARIYELATGRQAAKINHDDVVYGVLFSRDGQFVATASKDRTARLIDAASGQEISRITHNGEVSSIAFSPDSRWLATGSLDASVRLIEAASAKESRQIKTGGEVWGLVFSFDNKVLAIASKDKVIRLVEPATGRIREISGAGPVTRIAFSPDNRLLATGGEDNRVRLLEVATGKTLREFRHGGKVWHVAFSPDGHWLATGADDNSARLIRTASGRVAALVKHGGPVTAVAFSPDGKFLATASIDNIARLIETATGQEIARIEGGNAFTTVAFSPDSRLLAAGDGSGRVKIAEADPQQLFERLCQKDGRNLTQDEWRNNFGSLEPRHKTCAHWRN